MEPEEIICRDGYWFVAHENGVGRYESKEAAESGLALLKSMPFSSIVDQLADGIQSRLVMRNNINFHRDCFTMVYPRAGGSLPNSVG